MHDHVHNVITELPKSDMNYLLRLGKDINIWDFFPDNKLNNHIAITAPNNNVVPEWDEFDQKWYWVTTPPDIIE